MDVALSESAFARVILSREDGEGFPIGQKRIVRLRDPSVRSRTDLVCAIRNDNEHQCRGHESCCIRWQRVYHFGVMVANVHGPQFSGGANIAIKCPAHTYEQTVAFYRDTLALPLIEEEADGCIFQFGPNRLWVDLVPNLSQPDIWLELETNDTEAAASFLKVNGIPRRDEVEQLREDFDGFFISAPNGVIHLVIGHEEA